MVYSLRVNGANEVMESKEAINKLNKYSPIFKLLSLDKDNKIMKFELKIGKKCSQIFNMTIMDEDIEKLKKGLDAHQIVLDKIVITEGV